jgi:hypothetical protein
MSFSSRSAVALHLGRGVPVLLGLLDHANIRFDRLSIADLIRSWLDALDGQIPKEGVAQVLLRAYGGWYYGYSTSDDRFRAAQFYQKGCPASIRYKSLICSVGFEFADGLMSGIEREDAFEGYSSLISHTVALSKRRVHYKRSLDAADCKDSACELSQAGAAMRRGMACAYLKCTTPFSQAFERLEQKQVDTHLALDCAMASSVHQPSLHVGIVSNDWDILPALLYASAFSGVGSVAALRSSTTPTYLDGELESRGVRIVVLPSREA